MLNKEQEDEECDATDDDSSTEAGIKIIFLPDLDDILLSIAH
jgi:hypothetical protein